MNSLSAQSPTTPTLEDDIAHTRAWLARSDSPVENDYGRSDPELSETNSYPPLSSQEAETRRVEETLRQWEIAEKQRRRATRGSTSSTATAASSSLLGDVTRRASLLWKSGNRTRNLSVGGKHRALGSTDNLDTVPLGDIPASPTPTPSPSPTPSHSILPSLQQQPTPGMDNTTDAKKPVDSTSSDRDDDVTENPFDTPDNSIALDSASPFADIHQINRASTIESSAQENYSSQPSLYLDLPEHRIPPPLPVTSPPQPISSPNASHRKGKGSDDEANPIRWWHEWLCGCGEGSDRGGDNQAGRTNPNE